jgi:hypothetical protein
MRKQLILDKKAKSKGSEFVAAIPEKQEKNTILHHK